MWISPLVMVPVLSRHRVSTRARSSTEASSRRSASLRASLMTPAMKAMLVSNTNPSGTIATAAATTPVSASCQPSLAAIRRHINSAATGGISSINTRRIRLTPERSSESTSENRLASSANDAA